MSTIPGFVSDTFASSYVYDVVAIVDPDTGLQLFANAAAMKANIAPMSKIMDHPLEDGTPVSDFKIILPVSIELGLLLDANDADSTYAQIRDAFLDSTFLTVRTNADTYEDMVIEGLPHDETPDMFGMLAISLRLREIQLVSVQYQALPAAQVEQPTDQSTVNTGETQGQNSVLYDASQAFHKSN